MVFVHDRLNRAFSAAPDVSVPLLAARHSVRAVAIAAGALRMQRLSDTARATRDRVLLEIFRAAYACAVVTNDTVPEQMRLRLLEEARGAVRLSVGEDPGSLTEHLRRHIVDTAVAVTDDAIRLGCSVPALDAGESLLTADAAVDALVTALETDQLSPPEVMLALPLWPDDAGPARGALGRLRMAMRTRPDGWSVWIDWLDKVSLTPSDIRQTPPLELGIDTSLWSSNPAAANAAFKAKEDFADQRSTLMLEAAEAGSAEGDGARRTTNEQ